MGHNKKIYVFTCDYLRRLKEFKSFHRFLRKTNRIPKFMRNEIDISRGKHLYTYVTLLTSKEIHLHPGVGKIRQTTRSLSEIDRAIIVNNMAVILDKNTGNINLCHRVDDPEHPYMTLSEYIHHMETALDDKTIRATDIITLESTNFHQGIQSLAGDVRSMKDLYTIYARSLDNVKRPLDFGVADEVFFATVGYRKNLGFKR